MKRSSAVLNAMVGAILLAGVLVFGYFVALRHFARVDLTDDHVYTLTPATRQVVASLDKYPLTINAYFSERLPKVLKPQIDWIRDLLEEYRAFGRGNVKVQFVDPGAPSFPQTEKDNVEKGYGVKSIDLQEREKDSVQLVKTYLSIVLVYGDKHERVDLLDEKEAVIDLQSGTLLGFEYALTRAILKVSQEELKGVGILADQSTPAPKPNDPNPGMGFRHISELLDKQYRTRPIDVKRGEPVPDDVETLLLVKPKNLTEREAFEIDQFVMRGGKLVAFVDHYDADVGQGIKTKPITTGIDSLLEAYGFKLGEGMVADPSCGTLGRQRQQGIFQIVEQVPYPFLVVTGREGLDTQNPIVSRLKFLQLPWASPIELQKDKLGNKEVTVLAKSTSGAWTATDAPFTGDEQPLPPSGAPTGSKVLAAVAIGKFASPYAGKAIPKPAAPEKPKKPNEPESPDDADEIAKKDAERTVLAESPETRVLVVGSASTINDTFLTSQQTGVYSGLLLLNAVDWCTLGDELISLRTRGITNDTIAEIGDGKKDAVRWSNVLGIPVLLLIFWGVRRLFRGRAGARYLSSARRAA
jgi:gliding motility-associatede transport system auxiliary component